MSRPQHFYKYRSLDGRSEQFVEKIFAANELYFAAPSSFNDPFESRFRLSMDGSAEQRLDKITGLLRRENPQLTPDKAIAIASDMLMRPPVDFALKAEGELVEHLRSKLSVLAGDFTDKRVDVVALRRLAPRDLLAVRCIRLQHFRGSRKGDLWRCSSYIEVVRRHSDGHVPNNHSE